MEHLWLRLCQIDGSGPAGHPSVDPLAGHSLESFTENDKICGNICGKICGILWVGPTSCPHVWPSWQRTEAPALLKPSLGLGAESAAGSVALGLGFKIVRRSRLHPHHPQIQKLIGETWRHIKDYQSHWTSKQSSAHVSTMLPPSKSLNRAATRLCESAPLWGLGLAEVFPVLNAPLLMELRITMVNFGYFVYFCFRMLV